MGAWFAAGFAATLGHIVAGLVIAAGTVLGIAVVLVVITIVDSWLAKRKGS